jgi:hypothetical protein
MHEFNRKFLLSLSHSIRRQPNVFAEGGRLLDKMFSFEALNDLRERRIRATRDEYERKLKQFEATGKLDHDEELMLANQKRLSATTRSLEDLRTARLESDLRNADQHVQMVEDTNRLISAPMIRLARAITWACGDDAFYGPPTDPEDMQARCLVTWLLFDRSAERVEPKLTRFQTLPWFTTEDIDGHPMQGRSILQEHVAREHSTLVKVGEEAFDLVKLSLVGLGSRPEPESAQKNIAIPPKAPRRGARKRFSQEEDGKVWEAWKTKSHKSIAELAIALGRVEKEVRNALERERKRRAKKTLPNE